MRILIFGASGMVGQGVLRECLEAPDVVGITAVGRTAISRQHEKLTQLLIPDLFRIQAREANLKGFDACFFCLGVSSSGMTEAQYTHLTYDLTIAAAQMLARLNPNMVFVYVSGAGTDSTGKARSMWARVKGRTENDLLKLPFAAVYLFRPAFIQPLHGEQSKTISYRWLYKTTQPFVPILKRLFPQYFLTTQTVARAMLNAVRVGQDGGVLEVSAIAALAEGG